MAFSKPQPQTQVLEKSSPTHSFLNDSLDRPIPRWLPCHSLGRSWPLQRQRRIFTIQPGRAALNPSGAPAQAQRGSSNGTAPASHTCRGPSKAPSIPLLPESLQLPAQATGNRRSGPEKRPQSVHPPLATPKVQPSQVVSLVGCAPAPWEDTGGFNLGPQTPRLPHCIL